MEESSGAGGELGPTPLGVVTRAGTGLQTCKPQSAWSFINSRTGKGVGASRRGFLWGSRRGIEGGLARIGCGLSGQGPALVPSFSSLELSAAAGFVYCCKRLHVPAKGEWGGSSARLFHVS